MDEFVDYDATALIDELLDYNAAFIEKYTLRSVLKDLNLRVCEGCTEKQQHTVLKPSVYPIYFNNTRTRVRLFLCDTCIRDTRLLFDTYIKLKEHVAFERDYNIHSILDFIDFILDLKDENIHGYTL